MNQIHKTASAVSAARKQFYNALTYAMCSWPQLRASAMRGSDWRRFSRTPQLRAREQCAVQVGGGSVGRRRRMCERKAQLSLAAIQSDAAAPRERKVRLRLAVFESDAAAPHEHKVQLRLAAVQSDAAAPHERKARLRLAAVQSDTAYPRMCANWRQFSRTPQLRTHVRCAAQAVGNSVGHRRPAHERKARLRLSAVQSDAAATRESAMCSLVCRQFNLSPQTRAHARL